MTGDRYSRISARFWIDTKGWSERNRLVALYLLTNVHSTMEGLYHLPIGYLCADLQLSGKQAQVALSFVESQGIVTYDWYAEVVFVRKALKHGAPATAKHITGAINRLKAVPSTCLWNDFLMACECHSSVLANRIRDAFESSDSDSGSRTTNGIGAQSTSSFRDVVSTLRDQAAREGKE